MHLAELRTSSKVIASATAPIKKARNPIVERIALLQMRAIPKYCFALCLALHLQN